MYITVVLVLELPMYVEENYYKERVVFAVWDVQTIFNAASLTFFAFSCHIEAFPIYSELSNPT
jgi:amino acid permease